MRVAVACVTLASSLLYLASEAMELVAGGFSSTQLLSTYVAFALVPFVVLGLHSLQHAGADWTSLVGATAYGLAYVFYAGTAMYALAAKTTDYAALVHELGGLYVLHGALMVAGGLLFGTAVIRSRVFPWWTGLALLVGTGLALVLNLLELPASAQVLPSVIRTAAFVGMAVAALR
ncbi:MAG: hypothetical protein HYR51_06795 [Candidatus Rokubacteria bacterium]|nr:hypothetical protein [Candidatus Rokubacteria bacterium]